MKAPPVVYPSLPTWLWLLLGGLLAAGPRVGCAQEAGHRFFSTLTGLPNNMVQCVAQDQQGFLWLGTQDGLSRYDGTSFRAFRADARRLGTLNGNFVRALAPDPARGGLWVGTGNGLCYYDPRTERFASLPGPAAAAHFVNALFSDPAGPVWLGTEDGLWTYAPGTRHLRRCRLDAPSEPLGTGRREAVRALARGAAGTLWAGTGEGQLCRLDPATHQLRPEPRYGPASTAPLSALAAGPDGTLWAGTEGGELRYLPPSGGPVRVLERPQPGSAAIHSIWLDARGGAWVGSAAGLRYWPAQPPPGLPPLRLATEVLALGADREGQLWVGSAAGLHCLDIRPSPFAALPVGGLATTGPVWAVAATPGRLWLGTEHQGLLELQASTGAVRARWRHQPAQPGSLADDYVRCVLADADGGLWVGLQHHGLDYRPAGAAAFRHFRHAAARPGSLADDFVRCLYRDPLDGALWVGTEGGLCRLAPASAAGDAFTTYRQQPHAPAGLPSNYVRCVLRDGTGRLWVGTGGGGLCRLDDARTGRFTTFRANAREAHSLPSNFVRALCLDGAGRLWVGTEGGGLCRLDDARTGQFTTFGEAQGFPDEVVYGLLTDSASRTLWASTNHGLARLDLATNHLTTFNTRDGLPQEEYNAGAAGRGPGGMLYFGGPGGGVGFRAAALRPRPPGPVVLTALRRLNQPVALPDTALGRRRLLRLRPTDYVFTLEFAALDLRRADRYPLHYKLEGFDPGWLAAGPHPEATYTNLDPGRYTFRVRAAAAGPTPPEAVLHLVVAPPWYGTWWFRALALGALGLAGWLAYRLRVGQLLALERVRQRIARDLHDDIGSTLSSISIQAQLARHQLGPQPGPATELLEQIGSSSRRMLDAMDDIVWTINPQHDGLADVTARMRAFASEVLEPRGIGLDFVADAAVSALHLPMESRREFFLFYKEAVNNLAKYAHAQRAHIELTYLAGSLHLLVADDGVGFDPALPPRGSGNGLANMRARAAALHGQFALVAAPGQGTHVRLRVPL